MTVNFRALVWLVHYSYSLLKKYNGRVVVLSSAIGGKPRHRFKLLTYYLRRFNSTWLYFYLCCGRRNQWWYKNGLISFTLANPLAAFIRSLQTENGGVDFTIVNAARLEPTYTVMVADGSIETRDSEKSHYGISVWVACARNTTDSRFRKLRIVYYLPSKIEKISSPSLRLRRLARSRFDFRLKQLLAVFKAFDRTTALYSKVCFISIRSPLASSDFFLKGLPICREFAASGKCLRKNCPFAHISWNTPVTFRCERESTRECLFVCSSQQLYNKYTIEFCDWVSSLRLRVIVKTGTRPHFSADQKVDGALT